MEAHMRPNRLLLAAGVFVVVACTDRSTPLGPADFAGSLSTTKSGATTEL
jgi:hypothetical protein